MSLENSHKRMYNIFISTFNLKFCNIFDKIKFLYNFNIKIFLFAQHFPTLFPHTKLNSMYRYWIDLTNMSSVREMLSKDTQYNKKKK